MECGAQRLRHPQMSRGTDCRKLSRGISNTNPLPFHDGAYYPYTNEPQGTRSSAGIPSLLDSPLSQPSAPGMTPSSGASVALPFKFRPRRESVDWRRINAVDVDLVVSQLDLDALQEHIGSVTFCSLDGERCQRCHSPVDPALVKLLRLAQLTVEWLLHCQEFLAHNVRVAEERLAAAGREREQLLAQQKAQEEKAKALTAELKQRKKFIRAQQSMLAPRIPSGQKCLHCDKSFLNTSFLQNHMQRRHPDEYEMEFRSDSENKSQIEILKSVISGLKEQIVQQQLALETKAAQEKEHKDLQRELDHFKADEIARMDRKIEDGIRREMEFLYTRNIQALNEVNQNQTAKHEKPASPVPSQPERDLDNYRETQAVQKLEQQLKKQDKKWRSRQEEMNAQHESEKNHLLDELSRMQSSLSELQRQEQKLGRRLQEQEHTIKAQGEQIRNISSIPPTKVVEVPVILSAPAPEPKPKRVVLEEPVSAPKLDPIQELSEEEKDSSSFSERRPVEKKPGPAPEKKQRALKKNPNIKREMRPDLEQAVVKKLENLGVKSDQCGLNDKELSSILAMLHLKRESVARGMPDYWRQREEIVSTAEETLARQRRGRDPSAESQTRPRTVQVMQIRPRSSSLPARATQAVSGPAVKQPKTPQPVRATAQPKTSTPKTALRTFTSKTPPFSSDEESEEEDSDVKEERHQKPQRGKSPQPRLNQVQIRPSKASPVQSRQTQARQSFTSGPQQDWGPAGNVTKTAVATMESDEDEWSEVSELQEIDPKRLQSFKDQNGNVDKRNFGKESKINNLARKVEKQFSERTITKPAGGISILPERNDEVQELTFTDLEESSEWAVSSLEDRQETARPLRKSLDSPSTSVWGTSTGKGVKSGLTGGGTGSTLKSSMCSLSDISDSEDISNK
ncbi:cilium assembly protein DZIP1 isoform X5 [Gasterosteus aculeatus]